MAVIRVTKSENLATATGTCRPRPTVLIYRAPFVMLHKGEIVEKDSGHLFIVSSSSHFFSKTDFEQYLF